MSSVTGRRSFLDAIDLPVRVIRGQFRSLYGVAVAVSFIATLPGALMQLVTGNAQSTGLLPAPGLQAPVFALMFLAYVLSVVAQLTVFEAVRRSLDDEPVSLGPCLRKGMNPLSVVTVFACYVALLGGFICLCVPGVVIGLGMAFVVALLVDGESRGFAAIGRSWTLIYYRWSESSPRPMWLRAAGLALVFYLIYMALSSLTTLPAALLAFFLTLREAASGSGVSSQEMIARLTWMQVLVTLLGALVAALANLYAASAFTLLFRQAREEFDAPTIDRALSTRLDALAGEPR